MKKSKEVFCFIGAALFVSIALANPPNQSSPDASQTVKLNLIVTDKRGSPVQGLQKDAFQVFEEGQPQQITFFSAEVPALSYGILIDSSGSMKPNIRQVAEAATLMINRNRAGDETFVATMSDTTPIKQGAGRPSNPFTPTVLIDWTEDKTRLLGSTTGLLARGRTALLDSIYFCVELAGKRKTNEDQSKRRRTLVIITDGLEKDSYYKLDDLIVLTRKLDMQIFAIGLLESMVHITSPAYMRDRASQAADLLKRLTKETGGSVFFPLTDDDVRGVAAHIAELMRSQYVIGYQSPQGKKDYRKVRVSVKTEGRGKLEVIARPGYTLTQIATSRNQKKN